MRHLLLTFLSLNTLYILHAQESLARIEYGEAEAAYTAKNYENALSHLKKVKELLGSSNQRVMYLEIMCHADNLGYTEEAIDRVILQKGVTELAKLEKLSSLYVSEFSDSAPVEKLSKIYKIDQSLKGLFTETEHFQKGLDYILNKDFKNGVSELSTSCSLGSQKACEFSEKFFSPILEVLENMIEVKGGTFMMGCDDAPCEKDESPIHEVTLSDYYIGKYEITQSQYLALASLYQIIPVKLMGIPNASFRAEIGFKHPDCPECPVESITRIEAWNFCEYLGILTGLKFNLPSEAEWEYAARGGNLSQGYTYSGSNLASEVAHYNAPNTQPVGQLGPNELGLYDINGNVMEMCGDYYVEEFYKKSPDTNPYCGLGARQKRKPYEDGWHLVTRGGSYAEKNEAFVSITNRTHTRLFKSFTNVGFRIVRLTNQSLIHRY